MKKFIKVMSNDNEHNYVHTEIISTEDLVKVVKWYGNTGSAICFEWNCPIRNMRRQWIYDFGSERIRDDIFAKYEKLLVGEEIEFVSLPSPDTCKGGDAE